jgi:hypothetical protein
MNRSSNQREAPLTTQGTVWHRGLLGVWVIGCYFFGSLGHAQVTEKGVPPIQISEPRPNEEKGEPTLPVVPSSPTAPASELTSPGAADRKESDKEKEEIGRGLLPTLDLGDDLPPPPMKAAEEEEPVKEEVKAAAPVEEVAVKSEWQTPAPLVEVKTTGAEKNIQIATGLPPFQLRVAAENRDWTPVWWMPKSLVVQAVQLSAESRGTTPGARVPWQPMPWGGYGSILRARIPVPLLTTPLTEGEGPRRILYLEQGVAFGSDNQGWLLTASPLRLTMETIRKDGETSMTELVPLSGNTGVWSLRVPKDGAVVGNWVGAMLNAGRKEVGAELRNEELRMLLMAAGDIKWIIAPISEKKAN